MAIENVAELALETRIDPFGYRDDLGDTEVLIEIVGTTNLWIVLRGVSELKRTGISPAALEQVLLAGSDIGGLSVARPHLVWPFLVAENEVAEVARHGNAKRTPLIVTLCARYRPTADDLVQRSGEVEPFPPPEWQLVRPRKDQRLRDVVAAQRPVVF